MPLVVQMRLNQSLAKLVVLHDAFLCDVLTVPRNISLTAFEALTTALGSGDSLEYFLPYFARHRGRVSVVSRSVEPHDIRRSSSRETLSLT